MALTGHSGSHRVQSMHSSGSITRKLGPSWKQSTGHTSTQSVCLHLMQFSVTTKGIRALCGRLREGSEVAGNGTRTGPVGACGGAKMALPTRIELVFSP